MIKDAAIQLNATRNDDLVKVAGILQRLKDWYNSVFDPEYRHNIEELKNKSSSVSVHFNRLNSYIEKVNKAIKSGDVDSYNFALDQIKEISKVLSQELEQYEESATKAKAPDKKSDIIENIKFTNVVKDNIRKAIELTLKNNQVETVVIDDDFFKKLGDAIKDGKALSSGMAKPSKQNPNRDGELWVEIETKPIGIGPISMSFILVVTDLSARVGAVHVAKSQFSVKNIKKINVTKKTAKIASFVKNAFTVVPMKTTPVSMQDIAKALISVIGPSATKESVSWMLAQIALETANGKSIQNYNVGNISCWPSYNGNAWRPPWYNEPTESSSKRNKYLYNEMINKRAPSAFKAYNTLNEGISDYIKMLQKTFPEILSAHKTNNIDNIFSAIRKRYMPDRLSKDKEVKSKQNLSSLHSKYEQLPMVASLPSSGPALGYISPQTPAQNQNYPDDIRNLANYLGVALAQKPLTSFVKIASANKTKENTVLLTLSGEKYASAEYAFILSECIEKALLVKTAIYSSEYGLTISCTSDDDKIILSNALNALHNIVAEKFNNKYNIKISAAIRLNNKNLNKVSMIDLDKDRKKFLLKVL